MVVVSAVVVLLLPRRIVVVTAVVADDDDGWGDRRDRKLPRRSIRLLPVMEVEDRCVVVVD